jgi:glycosyltransferase involved in cell wall biosynthesis
MQVAIVVASYFPRVTGNAVSARRLVESLSSAGHEAKIVDVGALGAYVTDVIAAYEPDVVHAFHARRTGWLVRDRRPLVISLTGTDALRDLELAGKRERVLEACRAAQLLVVPSLESSRPLVEADPSLGPKVRVVEKGVRLEPSTWSLRGHLAIPPERRVFLLPGGYRPVKNQLEAIRALDGLDVELVLAGAPLDEAYFQELRREAAARPWVRFTEIRPHSRMSGALREADAVLNTSVTEGASNAVLEAMSCGRPVIASDITGNRALVAAGETGLLYRGGDDLRQAALRLRDDAALRATLGAAGAIRARARHSPERELDALLEVYREAAAAAARA